MQVTFYGVRGSVPAQGPQTVRYGGNTSCVEVRLSDDTTVVLDAGTGMRALGNELLKQGRFTPVHLLLSHTQRLLGRVPNILARLAVLLTAVSA